MSTKLEQLTDRLAEAEQTIQALLSGQVDAVIDAASRTPILLANAQSALSESEERYRQIVESTSDGIFKVDVADLIVFTNHRFAEMLGYTSHELLGQSIFSFMDEESRAFAIAAAKRPGEGTKETVDITFRCKDGSEVDVSMASAPILDQNGRYIGGVTLVRDMTEQKKMLAQLMVSDRMASVGTLAAGVAHEINNPLAVVMANLEYVGEVLKEPLGETPAADRARLETLKDPISEAREAADRVRVIVRDLKIFSHAEEDKLGAVAIEPVIESSLRMAWNEIRHRARIAKDYGVIPRVHANAARLGQVFLNLIVNAAQAIPEGHSESNELRIKTRSDDQGHVIIEISDTGPGIAPEVLKHLFTPFFTTKPAGVGTGLGLSICRRLVNSFGGEISVDTRLGKGTTFRLVLRPDRSAAAVVEGPTRIDAETVRPVRLLVVDDEKTIGALICRLLAPPHDVVSVTRAKEALERVTSGERFDVIISDLMMPEMTGMDLHEALLRTAPEQAQRMVFFTGGAFTPRAQAFLDTISNPRIEKPFDIASLQAAIAAQMR